MENERFSVPEVLFHPSDIGLDQGGIVETAAQSILALHPMEQELCSMNILLTGGNALLPGFKSRFDRDLRALLPQLIQVQVWRSINSSLLNEVK